MIARPRILTSSKARASQAGAAEVEAAHQGQDHYIDSGDLEHVEDGIKEPQYHRLADIALLFTGKAPDLSQNLDHACSPSFTPM